MGEVPMIENFHAAVFPPDSFKPFDVNDVTRVNKENTGDHSLFPLPITTLPGGPSPIKPPSTEIIEGAIIGSGSVLTAANDACGALPEWRIENQWGQVIAEDRGDGTGAHYYRISQKGKLIGEDGEEIKENDDKYTDKRVEISDLKELEQWFYFASILAWNNKLTPYAYLNGEKTSVMIGIKKQDGESWMSFSINSRNNCMNFFNGSWLSGGNAILESMSPGSYVVMEIRELLIDDNGYNTEQTWNVWHYNRDFSNNRYIQSFYRYVNMKTYFSNRISLFYGNDPYIRPDNDNQKGESNEKCYEQNHCTSDICIPFYLSPPKPITFCF